ncbi:uncharacterized protein LOC131648426 [Vicia villosa]|uniref:uncharacterized protein LOC131648426 n=1 Tax=Vicia villosa TaxID=3911 RepID=UPI00273CD32F|nr:uncharacterized protein LOC131648426 [Vicia villosa]
MENNLQVISKRVWKMVRVVFFMLRKGISKGKLMMNLNMMFKRRSKLAGKVIANLMSHHHHHGGSTSNRHSHNSHQQFTLSREYEFSCSNTPNNFFSNGNRHHVHNHKYNAQAPLADDDEVKTMNAMKAVFEMLNNDKTTVEASHAQSGSERQKLSDSPFPLRDDDEKEKQVDKAAEDFIKRFYSQLWKQD